jgi:gliding motility associated protien GldN
MQVKYWIVYAFLSLTMVLQAQQSAVMEWEEGTAPLDGIVEETNIGQKRVLPYPPIREADILWQKRVWRVLDTREKMNLPFRNPQMPFFTILTNEIENGGIQAYSTEDDAFTQSLHASDMRSLLYRVDTVLIINPDTGEEEYQVVENSINPEDIHQYRIKEVWFFDNRTSTLRVRILGIAPLLKVYDDSDNLRYTKPLFWIYYPDSRQALAKYKVFNPWTDSGVMSWEDHLEMRFFSSYVYKEANVNNYRLEDYLSGEALLQAAEKIKQEIFNKEQDMWSY